MKTILVLAAAIIFTACNKKIDYAYKVTALQAYKTSQGSLGIQITFDKPVNEAFVGSFEIRLTDGYQSWALITSRNFDGCALGVLSYETMIPYDRFAKPTQWHASGSVYLLDFKSESGPINIKKFKR